MRKTSVEDALNPIQACFPTFTDEARENQMINLAIDLAEKQLREGTASSQVITHYLKLGSTKEKLEKQILEKQAVLIDAKTASLYSSTRVEEIIREGLDAIKSYTASSITEGDNYIY